MSRRPRVPDIDFVVRRRAPGWLGWLALAFGCAASLFVFEGYRGLEDRVDALRTENRRAARAAEQARVLARRDQEDAGLRVRLELARKLSLQMGRNWQALFTDLEARGQNHAGVALLSVEPDAVRGLLRVTGEAKDIDAMFAYAESFADAHALGVPRIEVFEFKQRGNLQVVAFSLRLNWRPA